MMRLFFLTLALALAASSAQAQQRIDRRYGFEMKAAGVYPVSVGVGPVWTDITIASFFSVSETAPASTMALTDVSVINTHATQTLYVLLRAGGATPVAQAIAVQPNGGTVAFDGLLGSGTATIALLGSGVGTTGQVIATWR